LFFPDGSRGAVFEALVYAILNGEGMVKVVGEVGSGKTMLCRMLQVELPEDTEIVYLANPNLSPNDILHAVAFELKLEARKEDDRLEVMRRLQEYLLAKHADNQRVVVFIEEAKDALMGFVITRGRFPCPDCINDLTGTCAADASLVENDGLEDVWLGVCASTAAANQAGGWIPWSTLGISENDSWGNRLAYAVTASFADQTDGAAGGGAPLCLTVTTGVSFSLCSTANNQIFDDVDPGIPGGQIIADEVPAMIVSFGGNGKPTDSSSVNELENFDGDLIAVRRVMTQSGDFEFDDILVWISPTILMNRMVVAGRLP
jgi:hypothetical protein